MTTLLILGIWTAVGAAWWLVSVLLVSGARRTEPTSLQPDPRTLTVFKPLPGPLDEKEFDRLRGPLESFAADLDEASEMIIGCHQTDQDIVQVFVDDLRSRYPQADINLVAHEDPNSLPHPKVAWMRLLSGFAKGELWLWSDADIEAPPGTIRSLRSDISRPELRFVTSPYVVDSLDHAPQILDAMFVNVEFYPGAVLLGRLDAIRFGFGAGMLFAAEDFREKVDWNDLGCRLAEDFHLGRLLAPAGLGSTRLKTQPSADGWLDSILHYLRWQKTIRWCRPGSFASQVAVIPAVGWLLWLLFHPTQPAGWIGLGTVLAADAAAAVTICRLVGCSIGWRRLYALPIWSMARALSWIACWFPWPIVWRGKRWWSPTKTVATTAELLAPQSQSGLE